MTKPTEQEVYERFPEGTKLNNGNLIGELGCTFVVGKLRLTGEKNEVVVWDLLNTDSCYTIWRNGEWAKPIEASYEIF